MSQAVLSTTFGKIIPGSQLLDPSDSFGSASPAKFSGTPSFGDSLSTAFNQVNALQNDAASQATSFALGQVSDVHTVMIAAQKATVALQLTTQVRNKIVDAYQQIMQMQM